MHYIGCARSIQTRNEQVREGHHPVIIWTFVLDIIYNEGKLQGVIPVVVYDHTIEGFINEGDQLAVHGSVREGELSGPRRSITWQQTQNS
jgi:hypothetical protein